MTGSENHLPVLSTQGGSALWLPAAIRGRSLECGDGEILFREGTECPGVYFIETGSFELFMTTPKGRVLIRRAGAGELMGLGPVMLERPLQTTSVCTKAAHLQFYPRKEFHAHLKKSPDLWEHVLRALSFDSRIAQDRLCEIRASKPHH
ncbi:MAG: Crp/Fnr family transcriptional regulator [Acidobacteriales bacterium]|nr:Crp/Fnr family transcriptional regulator [Terriglobales bacterium]